MVSSQGCAGSTWSPGDGELLGDALGLLDGDALALLDGLDDGLALGLLLGLLDKARDASSK